VRVTYNQKDNKVIAKIIKARVSHFYIHFPTVCIDCRISINLEMNWDGSVEELEQLPNRDRGENPERNKDRLSYTHGPYQVDLTQVIQDRHGVSSQSPRQHFGSTNNIVGKREGA